MHIAVVGSYADPANARWPGRGTPEEFEAACTELGRLIAQGGHQLVVQFDKEGDADPFLVAGYIEAAKAMGPQAAHRIIVAKPKSSHKDPFADVKNQAPELFSTRLYDARRWDSVRYRAVAEADATILIGGRDRTEATGYVVLAAEKILLPIGSFGGAAAQLVADATSAAPPFTKSRVPLSREQLEENWSESLSGALRKWLTERNEPAIVLIHGRDTGARDGVLRVLTAELGLESPLIMQVMKIAGATLPEKW